MAKDKFEFVGDAPVDHQYLGRLEPGDVVGVESEAINLEWLDRVDPHVKPGSRKAMTHVLKAGGAKVAADEETEPTEGEVHHEVLAQVEAKAGLVGRREAQAILNAHEQPPHPDEPQEAAEDLLEEVPDQPAPEAAGGDDQQ